MIKDTHNNPPLWFVAALVVLVSGLAGLIGFLLVIFISKGLAWILQ